MGKRVALAVLLCGVASAWLGGCTGASLVASSRPPRLCDTKYLSDAFLELDGYPGPSDEDRLALKLARISKNSVNANERYWALRQLAEMDDEVKWLALVDALADEDPGVRLVADLLLHCPHDYRPLRSPHDYRPPTEEEICTCQENCWHWCVRTGRVSEQARR